MFVILANFKQNYYSVNFKYKMSASCFVAGLLSLHVMLFIAILFKIIIIYFIYYQISKFLENYLLNFRRMNISLKSFNNISYKNIT